MRRLFITTNSNTSTSSFIACYNSNTMHLLEKSEICFGIFYIKLLHRIEYSQNPARFPTEAAVYSMYVSPSVELHFSTLRQYHSMLLLQF